MVELGYRPARFGFGYLQRCFESHSIRVGAGRENGRSYMEGLNEDSLFVVLRFCPGIHDRRLRRFRMMKNTVERAARDY